jgi:DNA replication protein DnaC
METDLLMRQYCTQLRLPAVAANYRHFAEDAARANQPYDRFLLALLERELQQRALNQAQRRLRSAGFPVLYTLETFDFTALPQLNKTHILELAQGRWLAEHQNVILVGDIGTGKTHVGTALAAAACRQGRSVRFFTAAGLVNALLAAQDQSTLTKLLAKLQRVELVMLDELGFLPLSSRGAQLLFQFCSERYLRRSLLVTTNLTFDRWGELLGDPLLGGALVDRLTHQAQIVEFRGQSYRFRQSLARQGGAGRASATLLEPKAVARPNSTND